MTAPDWVDKAVTEVDEPSPLNNAQIGRLLRMTEALRDDSALMAQCAMIKQEVEAGEYEQAQALYDELDAAEQMATWVAPKYGGIFTTFERKVLKNLHKGEN